MSRSLFWLSDGGSCSRQTQRMAGLSQTRPKGPVDDLVRFQANGR